MVDSLSSLDAQFLHVEDEITPAHIGGVAIFDGPTPSYDDVVRLIESKLHLIPRYRQRVRWVPLGLGRPVWVDDPHYSTAYHVRHTALPPPGGDAELTALVGRLMGHRLDRDRPLWETWLVEGLEGDRWALVFKVHHCMVDGVAGVGLLQALLDISPDAPVADPQPWEPEPEPSPPALVLGAWSGLAADVLARAAQVPAAVTHPAATTRGVVDAARGVLAFGRHALPVPYLSIEGPVGPHRRWAHAEVPLADIKEIRRELGGTVNDVVLAAISAGFRALLEHQGDSVHDAVVRTMVPVSVRREDGDGVPDNRVSAMLVELPVAVDDPVERLTEVCRVMAESKGSHMAELGESVVHLGDLAPPMVLGPASRLVAQVLHTVTQRTITTVTTNVPGPQFPLYSLGREMLDYMPYVPVAAGVRVGVAILSYNGRVSFGVTGDYDSVPDPGILARATAAAVDELLAIARGTAPADV